MSNTCLTNPEDIAKRNEAFFVFQKFSVEEWRETSVNMYNDANVSSNAFYGLIADNPAQFLFLEKLTEDQQHNIIMAVHSTVAKEVNQRCQPSAPSSNVLRVALSSISKTFPEIQLSD